MKVLNFKDAVGAASGEGQHMLGKFLYFSLANLLVEKDKLSELCDSLGMPYAGGKRMSFADAFRSATGDVKDRISVVRDGEHKTFPVYFRGNQRSAEQISRELVKETLNQRTNQYRKLANIYFDRQDHCVGYDDLTDDLDVDALEVCRHAEELFERYQLCANRKQIETICTNYLRSLEATKVTGNGHNYFVPRHNMAKVDAFEAFIEAVNEINCTDKFLTANSFFIIDDAKQRDKMTEEFYAAVKKEIVEYQDKADYLIKSGSTSPAVLERWVNRIAGLEEKKRHYENVLRRELDGLDEEFGTLKFLSDELTIRARGLRARRAA